MRKKGAGSARIDSLTKFSSPSSSKSKAEINDLSKKLLTKYLEQEKEFQQSQKALSISKAKILSLETKIREVEYKLEEPFFLLKPKKKFG
ncbi:10073_t:CDS:2 [Gigaspora margarita]|uniref:10073_t:CDS:1 n=1 Tax=Gigaspora margarita TaxID=4874 RepID=A0ABN7URE2_GIGMA|nr:10073_t:CDS:2 [Gigaspora margarita]